MSATLEVRRLMKRFPIGGADLVKLGLTQGPRIGEILAAVEAVLDDAAMRERVAEVGAALDGYDSLAIVESALRQDFPAQALPVPNSPAA